MQPLLNAVRERGLDACLYPRDVVLGLGGYSLVLAHPDPRFAVKVTMCKPSIALLSCLFAEPQPGMVHVVEKWELGLLPNLKSPATAFVVERLAPVAPAAAGAFSAAASKAAVRALDGASKPPKRGTPEYLAFNVEYCRALGHFDTERQAEWWFLAQHLQARGDNRLSVDVLTEGNLLGRGGRLVISDPVRTVPPAHPAA